MENRTVEERVASLMAHRIEEMQATDKKLNLSYTLEQYILYALEEVQANDGVVVEIVNV